MVEWTGEDRELMKNFRYIYPPNGDRSTSLESFTEITNNYWVGQVLKAHSKRDPIPRVIRAKVGSPASGKTALRQTNLTLLRSPALANALREVTTETPLNISGDVTWRMGEKRGIDSGDITTERHKPFSPHEINIASAKTYELALTSLTNNIMTDMEIAVSGPGDRKTERVIGVDLILELCEFARSGTLDFPVIIILEFLVSGYIPRMWWLWYRESCQKLMANQRTNWKDDEWGARTAALPFIRAESDIYYHDKPNRTEDVEKYISGASGTQIAQIERYELVDRLLQMFESEPDYDESKTPQQIEDEARQFYTVLNFLQHESATAELVSTGKISVTEMKFQRVLKYDLLPRYAHWLIEKAKPDFSFIGFNNPMPVLDGNNNVGFIQYAEIPVNAAYRNWERMSPQYRIQG